MLGTAIHLWPILGTAPEKSKVAFYICGGAFASWAVILSLGLGMRRPNFPGSVRGQRIVIAISAVLMVATMSAAVITSGPRAEAKSAHPVAQPSASSKPLALAANPSGELKYNTKHLSAKAGAVSIEFMNSSPLMHNVTIAQGSKVLGATPTFLGGKHTLTLNLKPGTYTFYCSVPGHRQAGMEGTLTVS